RPDLSRLQLRQLYSRVLHDQRCAFGWISSASTVFASARSVALITLERARRSDKCGNGKRAARVKTAQRRRAVLTRQALPNNRIPERRADRRRSTRKRGARQVDWTRTFQRENRRLSEEPHQLLWRFRFIPVRIPVVRHEGEIVQRSQQAAIARPPERDL